MHEQVALLRASVIEDMHAYKLDGAMTDRLDRAEQNILRMLNVQNKINEFNGLEFKTVPSRLARLIARAIVGKAYNGASLFASALRTTQMK